MSNNTIRLENNKATPLPKVTRVEVIDYNGRSYVNLGANNSIEVAIQDDGRTLKIFIYSKPKQ